MDGVPFTVVGPLEKSNARGENSRQNNESIVGQLKYGNFTMLLQEMRKRKRKHPF